MTNEIRTDPAHYTHYIPLTDEWFAARRCKVTASKLAGCVNMDCSVSLNEALQVFRGHKTQFSSYVLRVMERGRLAEPLLIEAWETVLKGPPVIRTCGCWERDIFLATPDGIVYSPVDNRHYVFEVKSTASTTLSNNEKTPKDKACI